MGSINLFYLAIAGIAVAVAAAIVRAVRLTGAARDEASRHINLTRPDVARQLIDAIRAREVPCARCGRSTVAILETRNRYRCETCLFEFEGPAHIPSELPYEN